MEKRKKEKRGREEKRKEEKGKRRKEEYRKRRGGKEEKREKKKRETLVPTFLVRLQPISPQRSYPIGAPDSKPAGQTYPLQLQLST